MKIARRRLILDVVYVFLTKILPDLYEYSDVIVP